MESVVKIVESPKYTQQAAERVQVKMETSLPDEDAEVEAIGRGICAIVGGGVALVLSVFLGSYIWAIYYQSFPAISLIVVAAAITVVILGALIGSKTIDLAGGTSS